MQIKIFWIGKTDVHHLFTIGLDIFPLKKINARHPDEDQGEKRSSVQTKGGAKLMPSRDSCRDDVMLGAATRAEAIHRFASIKHEETQQVNDSTRGRIRASSFHIRFQYI